MKFVFSSQASHELKHNKLEALARPEEPNVRFCPHNDYCSLRKTQEGNCIAGFKDCKTYKFYNRYGKGGNYIGI